MISDWIMVLFPLINLAQYFFFYSFPDHRVDIPDEAQVPWNVFCNIASLPKLVLLTSSSWVVTGGINTVPSQIVWCTGSVICSCLSYSQRWNYKAAATSLRKGSKGAGCPQDELGECWSWGRQCRCRMIMVWDQINYSSMNASVS